MAIWRKKSSRLILESITFFVGLPKSGIVGTSSVNQALKNFNFSRSKIDVLIDPANLS